MQIRQINLNPIEATSYWWVREIRSKIIEINSLKDKNDRELEFLGLFNHFTDIEWRKLYLELNKYFSHKIENLSDKTGTKFYHQDTSLNHHNDLNEVLHMVLDKNIPDICLNLSGMEHSSICTNQYGADRIYSISGIVPLDTVYDYNYILSGDEKELVMKNLIYYLLDLGIHNQDALKKSFCDFYSNLYKDIDEEDIEDNFVRIFNQLNAQDNFSFMSSKLNSTDFSKKLQKSI